MKRILTVALTIGALTCVGVAPASADATLGSAFATAGKVTAGSGTSVSVTNTGDISSLIDFVTPVLNQVATPLASSLQALPSTVVGQLAGEFSGASAQSPATSQSPPGNGYPDCTQGGWSSDSCFGPLVPTVTAGAAVALASGTVQGYAAADSNGSYSAAQTAHPALTVLGIPIGDLGVSQSSTTCSTGGTCSTTPSLAGLSLLGGSVLARTAGDGSLQVSINGSAFSAASSYSTAVTLNAGGVSATAQASGTRLVISVSLTTDQLLAALGLPSLASVGATDAGSTIHLTIALGTGANAASGTGESWGLEVGIGLDVHVALSVLGLVTINVTAGDTSSTGDLADLELAYTNAQAAVSDTSVAQPDLK